MLHDDRVSFLDLTSRLLGKVLFVVSKDNFWLHLMTELFICFCVVNVVKKHDEADQR